MVQIHCMGVRDELNVLDGLQTSEISITIIRNTLGLRLKMYREDTHGSRTSLGSDAP